MPWKETCAMDERVMFIGECLRGELPMAALCERYGISRKTGYKWLERYRGDPIEGLLERPRAPRHRANKLSPEAGEKIVAVRRRYPYYGPLKLLVELGKRYPSERWPAASRADAAPAPRR
jgi:putative transposase